MTPKDKAIKLVNDFRDISLPSDCNLSGMGKEAAKECAVIAAELASTQCELQEDMEYWGRVVIEINKL